MNEVSVASCRWVSARSKDVVIALLTTTSWVGVGARPATRTRASLAFAGSAKVGSASATRATLSASRVPRGRGASFGMVLAYGSEVARKDRSPSYKAILICCARSSLGDVVARAAIPRREIGALDADRLGDDTPSHQPGKDGTTHAVSEESFE